MRDVATTVGEEFDLVDERLDELADQLVDVDADTGSGKNILEKARKLDQALAGLAYLAEEYGRDAEVHLSGLTAGDYARVEDRAAAMREQSSDPGDLPGSSSNVYAAMVLRSAPFLEGDDEQDGADGAPGLDERIAAVSSQPVGVRTWLEVRGDDLTTVAEGNYTPLVERLAAKASAD